MYICDDTCKKKEKGSHEGVLSGLVKEGCL